MQNSVLCRALLLCVWWVCGSPCLGCRYRKNYCFSCGLPPSASAVSAEAYAIRYTPNVLGQFRRQSRVIILCSRQGRLIILSAVPYDGPSKKLKSVIYDVQISISAESIALARKAAYCPL